MIPIGFSRLLADRYRLDRRLGQGGMGTVYEATDTALERRVATKLIRDDLVGSEEAAARFQREARATAAFAHPNVVTVHDFGVAADTRAFLVMELLAGTNLRDAIDRDGRLPAARTVEILRSVCAAVDAAHAQQLVHRDLKPENIFLAQSQTGEIAKVSTSASPSSSPRRSLRRPRRLPESWWGPGSTCRRSSCVAGRSSRRGTSGRSASSPTRC